MKSNENNSVAVVVVAAGRGARLGVANGPKQYRNFGGKSVLAHALDAFLNHDAVAHVVVAIHEDDRNLYCDAVGEHARLLPPVKGGATRQLSVLAGLEALTDQKPDMVLVHDAARPFVDHSVIDRVVDQLSTAEAALPALAVADTLKQSDGSSSVKGTVPRDNLHAAQTPQGFHFERLLSAHRTARDDGKTLFTDDSALAEWAGIEVRLVEGSRQNTKITTIEDLNEARAKMTVGIPDVRVGHGYDTHQLVEGKSIWLCGVELPHTHSLKGHSDADVGLHALTDALLAAIADGDIGSHFPPSDPKWKNAKSDQFLNHAVGRVQAAGGTITHMDVTLLCEEPKIGPHRDAMRVAIAEITSIEIARISVKATTNERIGFVGREEGMVALATATVVMGTLT